VLVVNFDDEKLLSFILMTIMRKYCIFEKNTLAKFCTNI